MPFSFSDIVCGLSVGIYQSKLHSEVGILEAEDGAHLISSQLSTSLNKCTGGAKCLALVFIHQ